ncbi:MAG: hypothetical protein ACREQJ_03030 [Candidatus Binatia bacterium]
MSARASPPDVDRGLRAAVDLLNRLPGVATRASCQGKTPAETGSHADLAYVLFDEPIPLTLEDRFLADLGEIAGIEPLGVQCRWPERNAEFCSRLTASTAERERHAATELWERSAIGAADAERAIGERILGERGGDLGWCLDCHRFDEVAVHRSHRCHLLFRAGDERTLAAFAAYLARDPPDPRLVEREGARAVLQRLRHGDFGASYREGWRRWAEQTAAGLLRGEIRLAVRALRSAEWTTDVCFAGARLELCGRRVA